MLAVIAPLRRRRPVVLRADADAGMSYRWWRVGVRAALGVALVFLLSGCRADLNVFVDVQNDGSGIVVAEAVLDEEAGRALLELDPNSDGIPLRDLSSAGWTVESPTSTETGTTVRASKRFGTTAQFGEVMNELTSSSGLFQDFELARVQSFGRLDYSVDGVVDTTAGFESFSDPALDQALGRSLLSIAERYGGETSDVTVNVEVVLPGELQEDTSTGQVDTSEAGLVLGRWTTSLANPGRMDVMLNTTRRSITAQVLRGLAVVAGVIAGLIVFGRAVRWLSGRRRPSKAVRKARPADALGRTPEQVAASAAKAATITGEHRAVDLTASGRDEEPPYRVVALDGMGVLYREGNDINRLLIPFARDGGSVAPDEEIAAKARLVSLGRITSADFWQSIGVQGNPNQLDAAYLAGHQLMPGVVKYLRNLRSRGIQVACITNDGARWATKLRTSHSLETLIDQWVVSGSVGVRKPDAPIFEVLRRITEEPAEAILIIDDDLDVLDAARDLGFGTAWFAPRGRRDDARGHELLRRFEVDDDDKVGTEPTSGS